MAAGEKPRSIIAMKGAPFTRKSEYATLIATSLSCPLLSLEDFLDILGPDNLKINPAKEYNLDSSQPPQNLSMLIIFQMAAKHLLKGVVNHVVIDSPLSSRVEFNALVSLASIIPNTRVVVVECEPRNLYLWRMLFDRYTTTSHSRPWFKPKIWDEIELAIENDCKLQDSLFNSHVSKLVLDPLQDYLYKPDIDPIHPSFERPAFMEAIEYLITRNDAHAPGVVVFSQWRQSVDRLSLTHKESSKKLETGNQWCNREGHHITSCAEIKGDETSNCMACEKEVSNGDLAYTCNICTLLLHKSCAESFEDDYKFRNPYPAIYRPWETVTCATCKERERGGRSWDNCSSCLFETNLKARQMPVIRTHDCDEHFLSLVLLASCGEKESYSCSACAELVRFLFYACRFCSKYYHINCVNEIPSRADHEHGGYNHHMRLMFSTPEEAEDYLCMECLELRDPLKWFYSCEECTLYEVHLGCILKKEEIGFCWKWRLPH